MLRALLMPKLTVNDVDLHGQRVFVRVDYNVPMEEAGGTMIINDETRIRATLPTLASLREQGARMVLAAHLGQSFVGGWVAARLGSSKPMLLAMIVGLASLAGGIMAMMDI